ncbi:histidine triad nucleotide-binding protein [Prochlorococcus sp. MIT 1223]|uniref:histidine triad nucleotide-binding protein n=1 Tax=Prochlorococcus sp. MIT 1223 TaxID=3096217 RepID=UPI002A762E2C|nr:histidine triad nucleotide-binding protein [Prochlorococcus sp. MIT 1223]
MTEETIFNRILKGEIPCDEIYRDELCLVFRDIQPQAPVHLLVIPKKNIPSLKEASHEDASLLGHLLLVSAKVANKEGLESWRTVINTGESAGQTVFHLHLHVIGGRDLLWPPG